MPIRVEDAPCVFEILLHANSNKTERIAPIDEQDVCTAIRFFGVQGGI